MNRAQQSPYGLGQGPPPGRFPPLRQASASVAAPTSPGQLRAPYPFGAAAQAAMSPQQGAALAHAAAEASLDPSDFPALGSGSSAVAGAGAPSQGAPPAGAPGAGPGAPASAAATAAHAAQQAQQQAALFASYASQASPALPAAAVAPSSALNGSAAAPGQQQGARRGDNLSSDEFPALGGLAGQLLPPGMGLGAPGSGSAGAGAADLAALAAGVNGLSLAAARAAVSPAGQEQASALAALQAQQQHRASLLGAMNGQRGAGGDKQSWTQSPQQASQFPAGLLPNGTPGAASSGSSPMPLSPSASDPSAPPHPQLPDPRSPSSLPPPPPSGPFANAALPPPTAGVSTGAVPQTPAQQVLFSPADRYGLLGLLHIIKTSDPDTSMLALGTDLTNLGLDLGSTENLYSTFITPWTDSKAAQVLNIEPEFHLPSCYNVQPPPANTKIGNFSDETLFFIFYSQPRDAMQEMAAHELYKHNWRYHKELRLWLTKEAGTEPVQKTATFERGSYIFFDPVLWERVRKEYVLFFDQLETRRAEVGRVGAGGL
ncbi:transcriptional regulator [Rhodotorula kratochvilovae]